MDGERLKQVVEDYAPSVYRLAYARTGRREDAEDVMQEVFLRLVRAEPEFRDEAHCKAWLLKVTANCAVSLFRTATRRRTEPLDEDMPDRTSDGAAEEVMDAVRTLPRQYRIAVHLFYYEGYSNREIGALLGKSEQAVKNVLFRARALLKERLKGGSCNV